jgi:hypothetical protein
MVSSSHPVIVTHLRGLVFFKPDPAIPVYLRRNMKAWKKCGKNYCFAETCEIAFIIKQKTLHNK